MMGNEPGDFFFSAFPLFSEEGRMELRTDVPLLTVIARGNPKAKGHALLVIEYVKEGTSKTAVNVVTDLVATTQEGKQPTREQIDSGDETLGILIRNVESKAREGDTPKDHVAWKITPSKEQESADYVHIYGKEHPSVLEIEILGKVKETKEYNIKNGYSYRPIKDRINCIFYVHKLLGLAGIKLDDCYKEGTAWDLVKAVKEYKEKQNSPKIQVPKAKL